MTDYELLRDYVEKGSEEAFRSLVQRHLNLVYGTAFRQLRDAALAEDAAQGVFVVLAQKAPFLIQGNLAGWLHKTALLKAKERYREEHRRKQREARAIELSTTMKEGHSIHEDLSGVLDETLVELREKDRKALLLRFMEDKSLKEVGGALGLSEDTAQKRVSSALEALARAFRRRGYTVPAAAAAAALREAACAAPVDLLGKAVSNALLVKTGLASATGITLFLLKLMSLTKPQIAALSLAFAAAPIAWQWNAGRELAAESAILKAQLSDAEALMGSMIFPSSAAARSSRVPPTTESTPAASVVAPGGNPFDWSANSSFVHVPKSLLPNIEIPATDENGLVMEEMARALELKPEQVRQANEALEDFYERYRTMEAEHLKPTEDHPTSIRFSGTAEQVSFIRDDFSEEYAPLAGRLKESLETILGSPQSEYFWKNTDDAPSLSTNYAAITKRVTLVRPAKEEFGGGPYFVGQEFRTAEGAWVNASMQRIDSVASLEAPQFREVIERWKREYVPQ